MTIKLDDATSIHDTVEMAKKVDAIIRRDKDVREVFARGGGAGLGADIRTANLVIHLKPRGERNRSQAAISDSIEADLAKEQGIRFWTVNELSGLRDVLLAVVGSDGEKVAAAARDIEKQMSDIPEVKNVLANAAPEHKELRVRVKQDQVAASGVSRDAIFETIRLGTIGDIAAAIPVFILRRSDRCPPVAGCRWRRAGRQLRLAAVPGLVPRYQGRQAHLGRQARRCHRGGGTDHPQPA